MSISWRNTDRFLTTHPEVGAVSITTLDQWTAQGREIIARAESASWDLADWAALAVKFGKKKDGEESDWHTLKEFCEAHGMNYGSVKHYAYVARSVPRSNRFDLSFAHHVEVAPLKEGQQQKWLEKAKAGNWPVAELRRQIRQSQGQQSAIEDNPKAPFELPGFERFDGFYSWLTEQPSDYWTTDTKQHWKDKLKPLVDLYQTL